MYTQMILPNLPHGIIVLLLFLPVIATIANFARYVLGIRTLGIYPALSLAFAFLLTGFRYGMIITTLVFAISSLSYSLIKYTRMHYVSKITVIYTANAIFLILAFTLFTQAPFFSNVLNLDFNEINPAGVLLIAVLIDFFVKQTVKKDWFTATRSFIETIIVSSIGFLIIRIPRFDLILVKYAWIIPLLIIVNVIIGQGSNLKLLEILRFKQIIVKPNPQDDKSS
ncbi:hypothetical protein GF357_03015 [Candidatus Dojkabacteria bacterium]|nr:hypothetical protein [Candidatus Dojkabacteria bacterium]